MAKGLKWQKLLWSIVIIFALTLYLYWLNTKSQSILGFSIYSYLAWPIAICLGLLVLLFRVFRTGILKDSFIYIFAGTANAFIGFIGTYLNFISLIKIASSMYLMYFSSILLAIFIFWDAFVKEIPGIIKKR